MNIFKRMAAYIVTKIKSLLGVYQLREEIQKVYAVQAAEFLNRNLYSNPKYKDTKRLNSFEYQVYSQSGEDGIIREIFRRIGTSNKAFAEFGTGNGLENNTTYLLVNGWKGYWIESSPEHIKNIKHAFASLISKNTLTVKNSLVTAENIEALFEGMGVPKDLDFLSIDIDGNDYWVWKAIANYRPRAVAIEYNTFMGPHTTWVIPYDPQFSGTGTRHFGASLKSLELLGKQKGYKLVGCSFSGVNAFFVREDLVGSLFCEPFTAENHYEPGRHFLIGMNANHIRDFRDFENI